MRLTVTSFKGGVGKTTTAVHPAAYLERRGSTLLVDGDKNRSATRWAARGRLPFTVAEIDQARRIASDYTHVVIDTQARPRREELQTLADGCDLLVIPTTPDALALDAQALTTDMLQALGGAARYRVLLTITPPPSRRRRVAFQKAALTGVLVSEVRDPRAEDGWADYQAVGKEILK